GTPGHVVDITAEITGAKQLFLVVSDAGDGFGCDWADWAEPVLIGPAGKKKLTDLKWKSADAGFGQVRIDANAGGQPLKINGQSVEFGIGTHANSVIAYDLPEGYTHFKARGGLDNGGTNQGCGSTVQFLVYTQQPPAVASPGGASREAEDAVAGLDVADDLEATLVASEPELLSLTNLDIDHRGRIWVCEVVNYRKHNGKREEGDRILILEDTDGDGTLDKSKVFIEGLNLVSGLEVGFGGVWVGAAPYLMFIPDKDGDDVPDGKPEILLDGWGYQDTHETLNAFIWGPDGWLYGCHGVFTHSRVGKPGTPDAERVPLNCCVWRYHPTRHEFDVFAHGTSNPWGVDFNDHGQAFITACVIPHLYHIIQGARYQRQGGQHFNPHTYRDIVTIADHLHYLGATPHSGNSKSDSAGGGHAHSGAMIYLGDRWPDQYRNQLLMNNIHGQRLNVDILESRGSGYVGRHGKDFLLTGDQASQIMNLRYGPDGDAWMIDWYDMQACHLREPSAHDRSNGRIYKIS
ncbi:MAG: NPCBM/NEW2 domain-containing protein, partial [Planctomycetales bacterium]|nr:NPCBM/NEW2 domain-containing protein [Planctomycetales bacterium]